MKKTILLCFIALCCIGAQAQVDNYAIRLGQGGSIDCGIMPELNGLDSYTLQFWVYGDTWPQGGTLLQRGDGLKVQTGGSNRLFISIGGKNVSLNNTLMAPGRWTQITLLGTGTSLQVWLNGNRVKTYSGAYTIPEDNASPFVIGGGSFEGRIDEIRIWNAELDSQFDYFVHTTLNKWVPQLDNLVAYFKGDQELCPNLVDYKPLFKKAETNHHGIFSPTGATLEKVTDNTGLPYLLNGAYTENIRFYDRGIDRDKYLLANDLIILGIDSYSDGHLEYTSPCDHGTVTNAEYLASYQGRSGVLDLHGKGAKLSTTTTAFSPGSDGFTFETWIYLEKWTEGAYIFRRETEDGKKGFSISLGSEDNNAVIVRVNGKKYVNINRLKVGKWMHMAVTPNQGGTTRTTFLFTYNGTASYATESLSDGSTDCYPEGMDGCIAYIGEGLTAKLDETVLWNRSFTEDVLKEHMSKIPFPAVGITVNPQLISSGTAYYRYNLARDPGYDHFSQDRLRDVMLLAYKNHRGYQVRISVRPHNNWQTTVADANKRKRFASDLARLSEGYDGVELDLEWMDGTQTNLGLLADEILAVLPKGKTLMISCHAYGAYQFPKAKIKNIDGFTMQQYGPQNTYTKWDNFISSYNSFVNYGFPKDKIYLSYSTTTSRGYDSNGTAQGTVVGLSWGGFLDEKTYTVDFTSNVDTHVYNGYTYYFMGPGQTYRRARHCVENNLKGIFYWDMGNDVKTKHPYSLAKYCSYALNSNVDTLVTEVAVNHPTAINPAYADTELDKVRLHVNAAEQLVGMDVPAGLALRELRLFATTGQCVAAGSGSRLSTRTLPTGVYVLRATLSDGRTVSRSFVKRR